MSLSRAELTEGIARAFSGGTLPPDAESSWQTMAELGLFMASAPENAGGLGLGVEAMAAIHFELGRALAPGNGIAQMLAIEALAAAADFDGRDALIESAMAGTPLTCSLMPPNGRFVAAVADADRATYLLRLTAYRAWLYPLADCTITPQPMWDETRRLFDVQLPADGGMIIAEGDTAAHLAERHEALMLLMLAADSLGGADAILDRTVDYLGTRQQFERPLAMFQALKHRVADLKIRQAAAQALLWSRAHDGITLDQARALKLLACDVYADTAEEAIQLHGGVGLTKEYYCHLFLKRAFLNRELGGDADRMAEATGGAVLEVFA